MKKRDEINGANTSWILTSTFLVILLNFLFINDIKSILLFFITMLIWFIFGYSLSFSHGGSIIGDLSNFLLKDVEIESLSGGIPESLFILFQMFFSTLSALIVYGITQNLLFSILSNIICYFCICHMVWGGGYLGGIGLMEFAGSGVVFLLSGIIGFIGNLILKQKFNIGNLIPIENLSKIGILLIGFFGFNGGSALAADWGAALSILVTFASICGGFLHLLFRINNLQNIDIFRNVLISLFSSSAISGDGGLEGGLLCGFIANLLTIPFLSKFPTALLIIPGIIGLLITAIIAHKKFGGMGLAEGITISEQFLKQLIGVVVIILVGILGGGISGYLTKIIN
jgi:ammonium transporter, Amt family